MLRRVTIQLDRSRLARKDKITRSYLQFLNTFEIYLFIH